MSSDDDDPTPCATFDVEEFAREWDERIRRAIGEPPFDEGPRLETADSLSDEILEEIYWARIGDERQIVVCVRTPEELLHVRRGSIEGFVLSLVDGRTSVGALLRECELPRLDALSALCALIDREVVVLFEPEVG